MVYKENKRAVDDHCIDPNNGLDLHYWSVILKTNPDELKAAIKLKGNAVAEVKKLLTDNKK